MTASQSRTFSNPANLLTSVRLALAMPVAGLILLGEPAILATTALFAAGALTDWLDGPVARRWGYVSRFGAMLDPLADKLLIDASLSALVIRQTLPLALAALFIGRDLLITGLRLSGRRHVDRLIPGRLAKLKTGILYLGVGGMILKPLTDPTLFTAAKLLLSVAAFLTVISALQYLRQVMFCNSRRSA